MKNESKAVQAKAKSKKAKAESKKAKTYPQLPLWDKYQIEREGNRVTYRLGEGVSLDIIETDEATDYGSINIYGMVTRVTYRTINRGANAGKVFISYPSYKKSDGSYTDLVTNYNKPLRDMLEIVLEDHYGGL